MRGHVAAAVGAGLPAAGEATASWLGGIFAEIDAGFIAAYQTESLGTVAAGISVEIGSAAILGICICLIALTIACVLDVYCTQFFRKSIAPSLRRAHPRLQHHGPNQSRSRRQIRPPIQIHSRYRSHAPSRPVVVAVVAVVATIVVGANAQTSCRRSSWSHF